MDKVRNRDRVLLGVQYRARGPNPPLALVGHRLFERQVDVRALVLVVGVVYFVRLEVSEVVPCLDRATRAQPLVVLFSFVALPPFLLAR